MIRIGAASVDLTNRLILPDGLRWEDELTWSPRVSTTEYSLAGALVVETGDRLAGRPITLVGGDRWAWMTRADVILLRALLDTPPANLTLTLHDASSHLVVPATGEDVLTCRTVRDLADPGSDEWMIIERIKLIEV